MTTELPTDYGIEMTDFHESPKYPRHRMMSDEGSSDFDDVQIVLPVPSNKDEPKRHITFADDVSSPDTTVASYSHNKSSSSDSSSPTVYLKYGFQKAFQSNSISKSYSNQKSKSVDVKSTRGNQFSVARKDASLLERIAHKAPKRTQRVLEPHEVFIELEELRCGASNELEWEETARWIKFEEDVEEEVGQWGRPHVSALAFHSLVDLRKGIEKGCVLLDVEGDNFPSIADKIVDHLVQEGYLSEDKVDFVLQALYKKHKHQHQVTLWDNLKHAAKSADGKLHDLGDQLRHRYNHSSSKLEQVQTDFSKENNGSSQLAISTSPKHEPNLSYETFDSKESIKESEPDKYENLKHADLNTGPHNAHPDSSSLSRDHKLSRSMQDLLKKIPEDAESLTVLVGGVTFLQDLQDPLVAFVRLKQSHLLGDLTEVPIPVRFIFLTLGPSGLIDYHEVGRAMATLMSDKCFHGTAYSSLSKDEIMDAIDQFLDDSIVLPPGDWDQDLILPLMHERNEKKLKKERKNEEILHTDAIKFSCRPCGGMIHDLKNLVKRYPSDIKDFLHLQTILSIIFIYISCIAPAIAFGGLMEEVTDTLIGVTETLVGTGLCGIVYGLFSVQPLTILAFTGPLLLFEEVIIEFAHLLHIEYLSWRASIGLWVMIIVIIYGIAEATFLVKNFTRFSEEIFTGVITLFFIVETIRTLIKIFDRNPICGIIYPCGKYAQCSNTCNCTYNESLYNGSGMEDTNSTDLPHAFTICNQPNIALWSVFLCFGVFSIAVVLRKFRQSRFLGKQGRRLVSDFGMLTAIAIMVTLAYFLRNTIAIEVLVVPDGWKPTNSLARDWIVNPIEGLQAYHVIGAIIPAVLLSTLIIIENQLTLFLVNKPEHRLKKDVGYHFDLCIVGILTGLCGILGLPWHCAASVRSFQHLQSLSYYNRRTAPGEKPQLSGVHEQRITNIAVHTLIILSPFAYPILREIPFSVAMGVFLYLAYASLSGIQLRTRLKLFLMPPKHHPDIHYVRKVKSWKMNLYTAIQMVLIVALFGLKLSPAGMLYPLAIVLCVPIRILLGKYIFTHVEIEALDSEEDFPDEENEEGDFAEYEQTHTPY